MFSAVLLVSLVAFAAGGLRHIPLSFPPALVLLPPLMFLGGDLTTSHNYSTWLVITYLLIGLYAANGLIRNGARLELEPLMRPVASMIFAGFIVGQLMVLTPVMHYGLVAVMVLLPLHLIMRSRFQDQPHAVWRLVHSHVFILMLVRHLFSGTVFYSGGLVSPKKPVDELRSIGVLVVSISALVGMLATPIDSGAIDWPIAGVAVMTAMVSYVLGWQFLGEHVSPANTSLYSWLLGVIGYSYLVRVNWEWLAN